MNTKRKAKILVVEDNPVNLELLLDILEIGGYDCSAAFEGTQAIEIAQREHPDLILLDIQLPGMDGIAVLQTLRSIPETRDIKTVALTAYAMRGDREMFLEKSFDGYLSKPVSVKELLEAVKGYLSASG